MTHGDCTAATATGDTTETLVGTITLSAKAKRITGIWCQTLGGALLTTAEAITGIFRLQGDSLGLEPAKYPIDQVNTLTSGVAALPTHIIPVNIQVTGLAQVNCYVTLDDDQTGALLARVGLLYED